MSRPEPSQTRLDPFEQVRQQVARGSGGVRLRPALGVLPFLVYLLIFLVVPTVTVVIGAFVERRAGSALANLASLADGSVADALLNSVLVSAVTALIGGVVGALLAYAVVSGRPDGMLRRLVTSVCGVLAQFGGVTLAFAFIATLGISGVVSVWLDAHVGTSLTSSTWLFSLPGLVLVYAYFQIPLMVIVFLPALDGIRVQWREAASNLGATTGQYWRYVGLPLLTPAFLGSLLLLFANSFAAYATAAALISQGSPIIPLWIRTALTSEVVLGRQNFAYALALEMIVIVAIVMAGYSAAGPSHVAVDPMTPQRAARQPAERLPGGGLRDLRAVLPDPAALDARLQHPGVQRQRPDGRGLGVAVHRSAAARLDHHLIGAGRPDRDPDAGAAGADHDLGPAPGAVDRPHG